MKGFFKPLKINLLTLLLIISGANITFAQVAVYDFAGGDGSQATNAAASSDANLTVSDMSKGSGLDYSSPFDYTGGFNAYAWSTSGSINTDDYYEFTITPNAGYEMTLTSLVLDETHNDVDATGGDYFWTVRSSLDGYATDIPTPFNVPENAIVTGNDGGVTSTGNNIDLTGGTFDNLSVPVTFRIYAYSVYDANTEWGIDNVNLNGSVSIATDNLALYNFDGNPGSPTANSSNANITANDFRASTPLMEEATNGTFSYNTWPDQVAIDLNSYYEFSIAPDAGYSYSLTNLQFKEQREHSDTPLNWELRSSLDGYTATLGSGSTTDNSFTTHDVDLTGGTFDNLTTPITFRLYAFNRGSYNTNREWDLDDVLLSGSVTAPTATNIATIDFQTTNYTLSSPSGSPDADSFFAVFAASDHGTGHSMENGPLAGVEGSSYLAYREGNVVASNNVINTTSIDVTSYDNLDLWFSLAATSGVNYEDVDIILIEYQFDGGGYTSLTQWAGTSGVSLMSEDADFTGGGDGVAATELSSTFKSFNRTIPKNGSMLDIRFTILTSTEDAAIDNIALFGSSDATAPEVTSITRQSPMTATTNATSVTYRVTFNEGVANVGTGDFTLSGSASGAINSVTPNSAIEYDVLVNTVSGDGNLNLDFAGGQDITDLAGNAFGGIINSEEEYTIDNTAPEVSTIERQFPPGATTSNTSVTFRITFDEPVVNVNLADFTLSGTASGTINSVTPNSTTEYDVLVNSVSGNGDNLNLDFAGGQDITDDVGNAFAGTINSEEEYTIDNTAPEVTSIIRQSPMAASTNATSVTFRVTFDEDVVNVGLADFTLSGTASGSINTVTPNSATEYDVLINTVSGTGNLNLNFAGGQDITDVIGNAFAGTINAEEEYDVDNTIPEVTSIIRQSPMTASTNATSVTFRVTFDEPVVNVGTGDFTLSGSASGSINTVTPNSTTEYDVLVNTVSGTGNLNLDFAGGQDITDDVGNAFAGTINAEEEYTIDNTIPEVTSIIRQSPMTANTTATSVTFRVTFDEPVVNVGTGDFTLSGTASGSINTVTPNSTSEYDVIVNTVSGNADNLNLDFAGGQDITDDAGNAFAGTINAEEEYNVDNTAPEVTSIIRQSPMTASTNATSVTFRVTFDEDVVNVGLADFTLSGTASGSINTVTPNSATEYDVLVNTVSGTGNLNLDFAGGQDITDVIGNAFAGTINAEEEYDVDNTIPEVTSIIRQSPMTASTNATSVTFRVTFDEPVVNVGTGDFTLSGSASGSINTVTPNSTTEYDVVVNTVSGDGNLNLDFAGGQDITDDVGNAFAGTINAEEEYTIDNTIPEVTSIIRQSPMTASTTATSVTFRVTFDEPVVNVGTGDFTLSGTASGSINAVTPNSTSEYDVIVNTVSGNGDNLNLDFAGGQDITDNVGNAYAGTINSEEEYTIDNTAPSLLATSTIATVGGTVVSGYWNSTNSSLNVIIPLDNTDATLDNGSVQIQGQVDGAGFENVGTSFTISNAERLAGTKTVNIADLSPANGTPDVEEITGFIEDGVLTFRAVVSDLIGNSTNYTQSANSFVIDQTLPTISPDEISYLSSSQLTFTLNEQLNFGPGATTGFTTTDGSLSSQNYSGVGTTNLVTLLGSGWTLSTEVNYTGVGNIVDLAGNPMAAFSNKPVTLNVINMGAGDLAFTYYRADDPNEFGFVLLKDIPAGTQIKFTNNGWNESTTSFRGGEETLTWEADVNYYAGTEIVISSTTPTTGSVTGSTLTLSTSGDQIFAYQGSAATPTFIAGIHNNGGWDGAVDSDQKSQQPSQLITAPPSSFNIGTESDNAGYDRGVLSGTVSAILTDINASANWSTDDNASNGISFTVPTGGLTAFALPPDLDAVVPADGSTVAASLSTLQIDFSENITQGFVFGGNVTITEFGVGTVATIPIASGLISTSTDKVNIDVSGITFNHASTYEIDVDGFLFQNADENHNTPIVGSTDWSFDIDGVAPTVNSINRGTAVPLNANFGTTASSVTYTVEFSEDVVPGTVTTADFTTAGTASGGTETVSNVTGAGDTYTVTVSSINQLGDLTVNFTGAINDLVGNTGSAGATGDESFVIINPEPSQQPTALNVVEGGDTFTLDLSWTAGGGAQAADGYLILYKTTAGSFPSDPIDLTAQANTFDGTNGVYNSATNSASISGLASATQYDFKIYPYTNSGNQIDYKTDATILTGSGMTGAGELSTLVLYNLSSSISSLRNSQVDAAAASPADFVFRIIDDGLNSAIDNAPTLISQITIRPDAGNAINWADAIEGVQLDDGTNIWNSDVNGGDITIDNTQITFSNLPTGSGQLGEIVDNGTKIYNLRIWLKTTISDAALQNTIDGLRFAFIADATSFTYETGSSKIEGAQTAGSSPYTTYNIVTVVATDLNWENPTSPVAIGVGSPFSSAPILEAVDANGNRDINYAGSISSLNNTGGLPMTNSPVGSVFSSGIYTFVTAGATAFSYGDAGDGSLTATSGALNASPTSSTITVSYSDGTTITAGALVENLDITPVYSSYAILKEFVITDDALAVIDDKVPTLITQITITAGAGANAITTDWTEAFNDVVLSDPTTTYFQTGVVNSNSVVFSSLNTVPDVNGKAVGYVPDDGSWTLQIYADMNEDFGPNLEDIIDNKNFIISITTSDINVAATSTSSIASAQSVVSDDAKNFVRITADRIAFDQQPPTEFLVNTEFQTATPILKATDQYGNRDEDYEGVNSTVIITDNTGTPFTPAPSTTFTNGELAFPSTFKYTAVVNPTQLLITPQNIYPPNIAPLGAILSDPFTIRVGKSTTITDGTAAPATLSSLETSDQTGIIAFNFNINDDADTEDDGNATLISQLSITQGSSFNDPDLSDWTAIIDKAELIDDEGVPNVLEGTVLTNSIQFTGIAISTGSLGYIADDATKNYSLRIYFKDSLDYRISNDLNNPPTLFVDNKKLEFVIDESNIILDSQSSLFVDSETSTSGDANAIDVDHTELSFFNVGDPSLNTPFSPLVYAQDIKGNTDIDFTEAITSYSNVSVIPGGALATSNNPNTSGDTFIAGVYTFPASYQFTESGEDVSITLETSTYNGGSAAVSNLFDIISSFDSNITLSSTQSATFEYVTYNAADITGAANAFELARFSINDGGNNGGTDIDGAITTLDEITFALTNGDNIQRIAIYNGASEVSEIAGGGATANFTGLGLSAPDDGSQEFIVYVTFTPVNVVDGELQQITITNAVQNGGSQFTYPEAGISAGNGAGTTASTNILNVTATNFDFTIDPNSVEGVNTTLLSTPELQAIDIHGNLDIDFTGSYNINTASATTNLSSGTFSNGLSTISGLQYTSIGDGTLTINEFPVTTITNSLALNISTDVEVVTTVFSSIDISAYPPQGNNTLFSGADNRTLVGFNLDANSVDGAFQVHFNNITVDFSKDITDIYENIRIYKIVGAGSQINVDYTLLASSAATSGTSIVINGFDEILNLAGNNRYLIVADVSPAAFGGSGPITASVSPQTSYLNVNNGNMTGTTSTGQAFNFQDNQGPLIVATNPVNKSISTPFTTTVFTITFDEDVLSENPVFELRRFNDNSLVSNFDIYTPQGGFEPTKSFDITFYQSALLITPVVLDQGTKYYITLQTNGFRDQTGNYNVTATTGSNSLENDIENQGFWSFTTTDLQAPFFVFDVDNSELVDKIYDVGFDIKVKLNEPGTAYVRVVPDGDPIPTDLYSSPDATVEVESENQFYYMSVRGLTANDPFDIYVGAEDIGGNQQTTPINGDNGTIQKVDEDTEASLSGLTLFSTDVDLCVGDFQPLNAPIVIMEGNSGDFSDASQRILDLSLPNGYSFNTAVGSVLAVPITGSGNISVAPTLTYVNSSTARIKFTPDNTNERDEIRISDLEIKATNAASSGILKLNSNSGLFDADAAILTLSSQPTATFTLNPNNSIINAISVEKVGLTQNNPVNPFLGETYSFSGSGVLNDTLYVDLAGLGIKTITLTQTLQGGCQAEGTEEVNIVNSQFSGLDFIYCSDNGVVPITVNVPSGEQFFGYFLDELDITQNQSDPMLQADPNSFVASGGTFTFDPNIAYPSGNTSEYVELQFDGKYRNVDNSNDSILLSQIVRVYPAPTISLTSITITDDDNDMIIEACEDQGTMVFNGEPESGSGSTGIYTLTYNENASNASAEIIQNSNGSISINSQALSDNFGPGSYTLEYSYNSSKTTCLGTAQLELIIYDKPIIDITAGTSCEGQLTDFTSSITGVADLTGAIYSWDFDDLTPVSNEINPSHIFAESGNYNVTLSVTTNKGCSDVGDIDLEAGAIPQTQFVFTGVNVQDTFEFTSETPDPSSSVTDNIATYFWEFGDGNSSLINDPNITSTTMSYSSVLLDSVRLTVTSTLGCFATASQPIAVLNKFDPITNPGDGFESGDEGWTILTSTNNSWSLSSNNADINQAGNNMWVTNPNQPYLINEVSYVYSPTLDFSSIDRPLVSFDAYWDLVNGGVLLEYSTDNINVADSRKTWQILGGLESGEDWYNRTELSLPSVTTGIAWSDSVGLQEPRHVLDFIDEANRNNVNFRFAFLSQDANPQRPGFAFDNFLIGERTRTVLLENFTNTSETEMTLQESNYLKTFDISDDIGTILVKINYHTDFPGDDPINQSNKVDPSARALFYDISETPTAIIDGTISDPENTGLPFSGWGVKQFNLRSLILAQFEIDLNVSSSNGAINIEAIPTPQNNSVLSQNVVMFAAILEKDITLSELGVSSVPSGETDFEFVLRDLLPNAAGTPLDLSNAVSQQPMNPINYSWIPDNVFDVTDLAVVIIVQNEITKEVYQSEIVIDVPDPGTTTSTIDEIVKTTFNLYPNPARDQLNVLLSNDLMGSTLRVFDNFGKEVYQKVVDTSEINLDVRDFASGMYHVQVISDNGTMMKRVIVSHNDR